MAAYLIGQIEITDPEAYDDYRRQVAPTMEGRGAKILVRGGDMNRLEGDWPYDRVVVLEFPSMEAARAWYDSAEYAGPKALRQGASRGNMILVEGV
jgi:uncharacterized protein (DUF1330 family)